MDNRLSRRAVSLGITGLALANLSVKLPLAFGAASEVKRTPDERFRNLPGYDFAPNYIDVKNNQTRDLCACITSMKVLAMDTSYFVFTVRHHGHIYIEA